MSNGTGPYIILAPIGQQGPQGERGPAGGSPNGRTVIGSVNMVNSDGVVVIDESSPSGTIVTGPPSPTSWVPYVVKNASPFAVTVIPFSGSIDGESDYIIANQNDSVTFYADLSGNLFTE